MKKLLLLCAALALYQNWGKVERLFQPMPEPLAGSAEVVLYATVWCGYCQKTRELLSDQGIPYTEYDIEKSAEARRHYERLNGRGVPVLTAGGKVIHGYNKKAILAAVGR